MPLVNWRGSRAKAETDVSTDVEERELILVDRPAAAIDEPAAADCYHCGAPCGRTTLEREGQRFCCHGCLTVHELLRENGLGHFYDLNRHPGVRVDPEGSPDQWSFLDDPEVERRLLDFSDDRTQRVTFHLPAIHCVACVWLLENLFQLHPGIGRSQVNFARREVSIRFAPDRVRLSGLAALLTSIGYEPALTLGHLEKRTPDPAPKRQMLQTGVAGFAFGNIMLFSLPGYLGLDSFNGPMFQQLFGWLSLALALPVLVFSASDYWRSALASYRQRVLTLDVPIALGLAALYGQSAWEILSQTGVGYLDSLAGLVFFLLCGRWFQQKTHARLAFDRDYRSFFPLAVTRRGTAGALQTVALSSLSVGDRLVLRHGELIPADSILVEGSALVDYGFVTGEAEPVVRAKGALIHAGGRQTGGVIEVEIVKPVSQSYLVSLWSHEAFQKPGSHDLQTLTNRYSRRFTVVVIAVAAVAGVAWIAAGQPARGVKAFVSVLIVACPCALALAAPFALGTAQRWLARAQVFLKNALILERLAGIDTIVFDKTGTLTRPEAQRVDFAGVPLTSAEAHLVSALVRQSIHPLAVRLTAALAVNEQSATVENFHETPGLGLEGRVDGHRVVVGSRRFFDQLHITRPEAAGECEVQSVGWSAALREPAADGTMVELAIDGRWRGTFRLTGGLRPDVDDLILGLAKTYSLALVSGDHERDQPRCRRLFGPDPELRFNQSPLDKLEYIRQRQAAGERVMMVGDGLNDAGALQQSDVGVAVVERVGTFSPASDVILASAGCRSWAE
jgi:P-type Cu+ transporter